LASRALLLLIPIIFAAAGAACGQASPQPAGESAAVDAGLAAERWCADGDESVQRRGAPCLCCHGDEFGVAGSVDPTASPVARIVVTDATGEVREAAPNLFGNFFRHYALVPPLTAVAYAPDGRAAFMTSGAPHGNCNACHFEGGPVAPIHGP
jgi:hypothetical protein